MVPILASHRRRLLQFLVVPLLHHLHEFSLSISRTDPVLKHCSIAKCTNFPFQRVLVRPKLIPNKRVMSILSQRCNLFRISERAASKVFCHISLYGSSNSLILDALEWEFHGASEYQPFLPCTSLYMCKIWWKQWGLLPNFWRCWRIWFLLWSRIHGNAFVMPAKQFKCTVYPQGDSRE